MLFIHLFNLPQYWARHRQLLSIDKLHDVDNQIGRNHCQCSIEDSQGYFMSNKTVEEALN